jgi:hypothetical protein
MSKSRGRQRGAPHLIYSNVKTLPKYAPEALRQAFEIAAQRGPGVYIQTIAHDDWCDFMNGRGACNCAPEINTKPARDDA